MKEQKSVRNHYVPQFYLRNWSADETSLFVYRKLVSSQSVPMWEKKSIRGIACVDNLYAQKDQSEESDQYEEWLNHEVETPAKDVLSKILLTDTIKLDYFEKRVLTRFIAAQSVRVPAYYERSSKAWIEELPETIESTLQGAIVKLERYQKSGARPPTRTSNPLHTQFPISLELKKDAESGVANAHVGVLVGRKMWLVHLRRMVDKTADILMDHKWNLVKAAHGSILPTSDDPVVCFNSYGNGQFDFHGGWKKKNSEIILPLSPARLLYTCVGSKRSTEVLDFNRQYTDYFQRIIFRHAFLEIYSQTSMKSMYQNCPRTVDPIQFQRIQQLIKNWHRDHSLGEASFGLENEIGGSN